MKNLANNYLSKKLIAFLTIGIIFFGVLSITTMQHETGMTMDSSSPAISQTSDCSDSHTAQTCVDFHLGIMQNLSSASFGSLGLKLILTLIISFVGLFLLSLFKTSTYSYHLSRIRLRQLYEKTVFAFTRQLGHWLSLFEKRDPAYAFIIT